MQFCCTFIWALYNYTKLNFWTPLRKIARLLRFANLCVCIFFLLYFAFLPLKCHLVNPPHLFSYFFYPNWLHYVKFPPFAQRCPKNVKCILLSRTVTFIMPICKVVIAIQYNAHVQRNCDNYFYKYICFRSRDFLFVVVGLINILLLQFFLVVILHYTRLDMYHPPSLWFKSPPLETANCMDDDDDLYPSKTSFSSWSSFFNALGWSMTCTNLHHYDLRHHLWRHQIF